MFIALVLAAIVAVILLAVLSCCKAAGEADEQMEGYQVVSPCYIPPEPTDEDTLHPQEIPFTADVTDEDIVLAAKVVWGEARGIKSRMEQAAVVWTMLNRVDAFGDSLGKVATASNQFAYDEDNPTIDDFGRDLTELVRDVVDRWEAEKNGVDSGRVLPKEYLWFGGENGHNWFRSEYELSGDAWEYDIWDWSLPDPYGEVG